MSLFLFTRSRRGASRRPLGRAALGAAMLLGSFSGVLTAEPATASAPAPAPANGLAALTPTPPMGWSSWDYIRKNPTAANIEAEADYLVSSGLSTAGYKLVSIDDFWMSCDTYSAAMGHNTYDTDANGYWTPSSAFPGGIKPVADYVHKLGLQLGIYLTPGLPWSGDGKPIAGTGYNTDQIKVSSTPGQDETNYNCATTLGGSPGGNNGMDYINYNTPATPNAGQDYVNGWADLLASWGVDHLKLDGVGSNDTADIQAWSTALQQAPRPISLALSNGGGVGAGIAPTVAQYANSWRIDGDVNSYQASVYPLTSWSHVSARFDDAASWAPWGGSGHWNDLDSVEVGNGGNDGLTVDERQSTLALWAMASSPLMIGADLTNLDPTDLAMLKNPGLIQVDQNGAAATRVYNEAGLQVWNKTLGADEQAVAFFNTSGTATTYDVGSYLPSVALTGSDTLTDVLGDANLQPVPSSATDRTVTVPSHGVAIVGVTGPAGLRPAACGTPATFTVPAGAHTMRALVAGAPGQTGWGTGGGGGQAGGAGGAVLATVSVTPGQTVSAVTGCTSTTNSGGAGWSTGGGSMSGGGTGGGSSAVCASSTCSAGSGTPLVVAGGGGGGGGGTCNGYWGWPGGAGGGSSTSVTSDPGATGSGPSGANGVASGNPGGLGGANNGSTGNNGSPNGGSGSVHDGDSGGGAGMVGGWGGNDWGLGCQSQGGGGGGSSWVSATAGTGTVFATSQVAQATVWFS
ncbi:glycoside hydrolase family 27 protein [Kitasatospora sp. NBC_01266]|uniref:glycoside hydrolase family 27 protein n=1 Tax=Kitasatospora sp. NBC_01266 TaxID=2903572 RepID=UPI002E329870|nr:glycoside hydrolase family 27 protein [Kitasatospora sp. NBC_01266]